MPTQIEARYREVLLRLRAAEQRCARAPGSVTLLAVSKKQSIEAIAALAQCGQRAFGENYVQEALNKIAALGEANLSWHFIGRIQANKTRAISAHFDWVHTLDRVRVAQRLGSQRAASASPLNCLVEVNVSGEDSKAGVAPEALGEFLGAVRDIAGIRVRGLMTLPKPSSDFRAQKVTFDRLHELYRHYDEGDFDTLSMGTSGDFEAAVAAGATIVRLGTVLFGPRV